MLYLKILLLILSSILRSKICILYEICASASSLGSPPQERYSLTGLSPVKGHLDYYGMGASHLWVKAESWDCSVWSREKSGESHPCTQPSEGKEHEGQALFSGTQWQGQRQQTQMEMQEVPSGYQGTLSSLSGWSRTGTGWLEKLWSLHPCRY